MKLKSLIPRPLIKEDEVDDTFEKVAFGSDIDIAKLQRKSQEEDTELESKIKNIIAVYIKKPDSANKETLYKYLDLFKKAKKRFPNIFGESIVGDIVWRGLEDIQINLYNFIRNTTINDWGRLQSVNGKEIPYDNFLVCKIPFKYSPRSVIQSWSLRSTVADFFSSKGGDNDYQAILLTTVGEDFFFTPEFLNSGFTEQLNEYETIHFGMKYEKKIYICIRYGLADHTEGLDMLMRTILGGTDLKTYSMAERINFIRNEFDIIT
jgi:hypothetical protein